MTTVKTFLNSADAALAQCLLQAAGIESIVTDDSPGYIYANEGIRLQVPDPDAKIAAEVLETEQPLPDDFMPPESRPYPAEVADSERELLVPLAALLVLLVVLFFYLARHPV